MPSGPDLARQCVAKLKPVRFGVYSSTDRIVRGIEHALAGSMDISERQRLTLYKICWRYREQIADWNFQARVLIARAHLEELVDVATLEDERVYVRSWHAPAAGLSKAARNAVVDLFEARG
jgi:hypothetical protein